jgi:D-3-phosphoglycerate dehydrogenase/(S)-sulfolactate dehydrogenase
MRMKVVVPEHVDEEAIALLEEHAEVLYDPRLHQDEEALAAALSDAAALIVRNKTFVGPDLLARAPELKVVGRVGVGLDNLDLAALRERRVVATWAPGTNAVSVAEYVMGAILEFARRFAPVSNALHRGTWDRQGAIGHEIYGTTLGIVGLGDIGTRLAHRAQAFGMKVLATDPAIHEGTLGVQEFEAQRVELDELLQASDVVSLHAPLTDGTRDLVNAATLARMKPSAVLVNTARGGLVDEEALADALRNGRLAGAALDVRREEPPGEDDPLRGLPNVILTPHVAGVTRESMRRASLHVANDVLRVLAGETPVSVVP